MASARASAKLRDGSAAKARSRGPSWLTYQGVPWRQPVPVPSGALSPSRTTARPGARTPAQSSSFGAGLDRRLHDADDLEHLDKLPAHVAELVRAAWDLGGRPELGILGLRAWAHMLGFRGHWSTKSRRYSTTMTALRRARVAFARRRRALCRYWLCPEGSGGSRSRPLPGPENSDGLPARS